LVNTFHEKTNEAYSNAIDENNDDDKNNNNDENNKKNESADDKKETIDGDFGTTLVTLSKVTAVYRKAVRKYI